MDIAAVLGVDVPVQLQDAANAVGNAASMAQSLSAPETALKRPFGGSSQNPLA